MPPEEPPPISVLDARLAEIDRRLSSIQTGLAVAGEESAAPAPGAELPPRVEVADPPAAPPPPPAQPPARPAAHPPPTAPPPRPAPAPTAAPPPPAELAALLGELRRLAAAHEQVLESTRGLLAACERVLARVGADESVAAVREFSVSAGPFSSTEALRGFRQTLAEIPQVREVSVRGFEGGDRAIVDVQLFEPNP